MRLDSGGRNFVVYADTQDNGLPIELASVEQEGKKMVLASGDNITDDVRTSLVDFSKSTLPFFADVYNISANAKDYVLVPVVIMPSELPNRNCVGFPFEELTKANADMGMLGYQTWRAKPTFADHNNKDCSKAKGIIFSSVMKPIQKAQGDLWKVVCLCGFDRSRDPILANSILTGERNAYSMGAWSGGFSCSICAAVHGHGPQACEHLNLKMPRMATFRDSRGREQLAFFKSRNICGFETSSVVQPAYLSAVTDYIMPWESPA